MDEAVWISIGLISIFLLFGILFTMYQDRAEQEKSTAIERGVAQIAESCQKVCRMPSETYLSFGVNLPSGAVIEVDEERICGHYQDSTSCALCECTTKEYLLDLNNSQARELYDVREFECFFLNEDRTISIECQG